MAFVKGSKAFIIGYGLGTGNQAKNTVDINSFISSITSNMGSRFNKSRFYFFWKYR
jgi:hypothetical protein